MDFAEYIQTFFNADPGESYPSDIPSELRIENFSQIKKVTKPWGFELWLADAHDTPYALKIIYLKQGTKTSLQLHHEKTEHNCILSGEVRLHYESVNGGVTSVALNAGHVVAIQPNTVHRIEALTDVVLVEASSHQLDDVVRLADDYKRPDGKIDSEHQS